MSSDQIIVLYGTARPPAESAVTRELRPNFNGANQIISFTESWTIAGDILPGEGETPSASLLRTKLDALISQFEVPGYHLKRQTEGGVIIDEINPAYCQWGPRLADVSFPSGADSVIPVRLPFSIRMEAEVRPPSLEAIDVLDFQETLQHIPEPRYEWQGGRYFPGRIVRVRNFPGVMYRQQGRAVTLANLFVIPPPLFPRYMLGDPQINEQSRKPGKSGNQWKNLGREVTWQYEFALPFRVFNARPHQWPGSTL